MHNFDAWNSHVPLTPARMRAASMFQLLHALICIALLLTQGSDARTSSSDSLTRSLCAAVKAPYVEVFPVHAPNVWTAVNNAIERTDLDPEGMFNVLSSLRIVIMLQENVVIGACGDEVERIANIGFRHTEARKWRAHELRELYDHFTRDDPSALYCHASTCTLQEANDLLAKLRDRTPEEFRDLMRYYMSFLAKDLEDRFGVYGLFPPPEDRATVHLSPDPTYRPLALLWTSILQSDPHLFEYMHRDLL